MKYAIIHMLHIGLAGAIVLSMAGCEKPNLLFGMPMGSCPTEATAWHLVLSRIIRISHML